MVSRISNSLRLWLSVPFVATGSSVSHSEEIGRVLRVEGEGTVLLKRSPSDLGKVIPPGRMTKRIPLYEGNSFKVTGQATVFYVIGNKPKYQTSPAISEISKEVSTANKVSMFIVGGRQDGPQLPPRKKGQTIVRLGSIGRDRVFLPTTGALTISWVEEDSLDEVVLVEILYKESHLCTDSVSAAVSVGPARVMDSETIANALREASAWGQDIVIRFRYRSGETDDQLLRVLGASDSAELNLIAGLSEKSWFERTITQAELLRAKQCFMQEAGLCFLWWNRSEDDYSALVAVHEIAEQNLYGRLQMYCRAKLKTFSEKR